MRARQLSLRCAVMASSFIGVYRRAPRRRDRQERSLRAQVRRNEHGLAERPRRHDDGSALPSVARTAETRRG